jgi:hypothetical protein
MTYNELPVYNVSLRDFSMIADCILSNKRLLSKNIENSELKSFYIKSHKPKFYISYDGILLLWL